MSWSTECRMSAKRKPRKGGRTERLSARLTPETAAQLRALAVAEGLSATDVLTRLIRAAARKMA